MSRKRRKLRAAGLSVNKARDAENTDINPGRRMKAFMSGTLVLSANVIHAHKYSYAATTWQTAQLFKSISHAALRWGPMPADCNA